MKIDVLFLKMMIFDRILVNVFSCFRIFDQNSMNFDKTGDIKNDENLWPSFENIYEMQRLPLKLTPFWWHRKSIKNRICDFMTSILTPYFRVSKMTHVLLSLPSAYPKVVKIDKSRNRCFAISIKRCEKTKHEMSHDILINFDVKNRFLSILTTFYGKSSTLILKTSKTENHRTVPDFDDQPPKMTSKNRQKSIFLPVPIFDDFWWFLRNRCFFDVKYRCRSWCHLYVFLKIIEMTKSRKNGYTPKDDHRFLGSFSLWLVSISGLWKTGQKSKSMIFD